MWRQGMFVLPFMTRLGYLNLVVGQLAVNPQTQEFGVMTMLQRNRSLFAAYLALGYGI
jgi:hypothetical protein